MDDLSVKVADQKALPYDEKESAEAIGTVDKMLSEILAEVTSIEETRTEEILKAPIQII